MKEVGSLYIKISNGLDDPQQLIDLSRRAIAVGQQGAAWAKERGEVAAKAAAKFRDQLTNKEIILYHIENDLSFSVPVHGSNHLYSDFVIPLA